MLGERTQAAHGGWCQRDPCSRGPKPPFSQAVSQPTPSGLHLEPLTAGSVGCPCRRLPQPQACSHFLSLTRSWPCLRVSVSGPVTPGGHTGPLVTGFLEAGLSKDRHRVPRGPPWSMPGGNDGCGQSWPVICVCTTGKLSMLLHFKCLGGKNQKDNSLDTRKRYEMKPQCSSVVSVDQPL